MHTWVFFGPFPFQDELIEEVEMGPFKQIKDGGLDTRKVAFECMYTLLDNSLDRLDIFEFLQHVEDGLKDHYDIKVSWRGDTRPTTYRENQRYVT